MENVLKLYKYIDGSNDTPFPNVEYQAVVSDFRYDVKRMGGAPIITCTVMHTLCLDKLWSENVYAYFNGERFFIKQIPTSSYSNTDSRYKHELELVSERFVLDNVYFYDVVDSSENNDKPVSNSSKFSFFGDINEFASRLNQSLQYSNVDYSVVVDDGISSEAKMVSFQDQFFSGAIQEGYNTYNVPFYFEGKVIHFGYTNNAITRTFKYGDKESLLSIQKQNANYKVVNRVTGVGSEDNIPYYYPNDYESKEEVEANGGTWINPQTNLMPSIYRETLGSERFYNAINFAYENPISGTLYEFANPYVEGKPKEHIVNFEDIKPTIKGITNASGYRIDMFSAFAYDTNDNDEVDEEGNYVHPYFFAKLRRFDGEHGFNLFDHAIDEQEMTISMTSGSCGACEFVIGVDESTQKNTVQVDDNGYLERDDDGNVKFGTPQDKQNDTINNEVWIALRKDIDTFGVIMPNATNNYKPSVNDTFVILHIDLPKAYILAAEDNLKNQLIEYMALNNSEKFNFSISFSRIFFAEHPDILAQLNENARIQIEYDNTNYELYISSYSYSMSSDKPLPEIRVELSDTLTISQNALQTAINEIKSEIISSGGSGNVRPNDILKLGLKYFLRKDTDDRSKGKVASDKGFEVGKFVAGASGAIIYKDEENGQTVAEFDKLYVRMKAYFETLEIINVNTIGGKQIISPAGSVKCIGVEETDNAYRCYFLAEQDGEKVQNRFLVYDQIYSQMFDAVEGTSQNVSTHYFWRLCIAKSKEPVTFENKSCHYIDLSKTDCDKDSDVPMVGDVLNQRGNRTDLDRMNFIEMSSVDAFSPNITLFHGVNSYSLNGKAYVSYGVDKSTNKAFMNVYGDMYVGDRQNTSYMRYTKENGLEISGKLDIGTKLGDTPLKDLISASSPEGYQEFVEKVTQDIEGLQAQIDGAIESYFYQYDPTFGNYPASEWIANGTEKAHLNDTFTNLDSGYSWRWSLDGTTYKWVEITDTATTKALALAGQAKDTADGKRRVFVDTPTPPYDKGDLWSRGSDYPLMVCVNTKDKNGVYEVSDFDYADNNAKLKEEMQSLVTETKGELNNAIGQAKNEAVNNANAYTDQGKQALQESIDALESSKANLDDVYTRAQADGKISESETNAINAAKAQADAAIALSEITIKAYADGIVDEEEAARIKQAKENLDAAKKYADEQAQKAIDEANDTYGYLAKALGTEVDGGLLLTSIIQMRDTDQNIMSGINGLTAKGDKSIATWWGGGMYDMFNYYDWDGAKWVAKKNIQIPSNVPSGVIRMDGTGYLAKGKFWWDDSGKIYADPTALFLMFDVEDESASLSQTILAMRDKQTEFESMWEFKTDSNGRKYLLSKYPLVTQEGITMYGGVGTTIPSIYDGLPIDGVTIYWENGILKAQGGGNDGIDEEQLAEYLTTNNYAKKSDIPSLSGYATQTWVASQGYITGITSAMVTSALGFTPYNANNFTKANIKSTLGISDWALATSKPSYTYTEIGGTPDLSVYALKTSLSSYQPLISTTNKLAYSLVSGTPTSLKNPTSLTFGSKTYDGSEAKTITASDLGALTSHQTIYALTLQAGAFSAGTYTPNSSAKTINIPTTTAHISESGNLYFTNARAVSALSSTLASYVTLGGSQTITGAKNFTGGLSVNGGSLVYNASEGYWKLEGDLLVTGGVTMYGNEGTFTPSTIMDAIAVDGTTISKSGGVLKVIGGTGGVADSVAWANITGKPTFATVATSGKYSDLSGTPSSLPASDVYSWAKSATKPTYTWSEITSKPTWIGSSKPTYSYSEITGAISTTELQNYLTSNSYLNVTGGDNRYLKLSGGTITGNVTLKAALYGENYISWKNPETAEGGYFYGTSFNASKNYTWTKSLLNWNVDTGVINFIKTPTVNGDSVWHSGNDGSGSSLDADLLDGYHASIASNTPWGTIPVITPNGNMDVGQHFEFHYDNTTGSDYSTILGCTGNYSNIVNLPSKSGTLALTTDNVASATKLQSARTIWGQSFDGTGNVSGNLIGSNFGIYDVGGNPYIEFSSGGVSTLMQMLATGALSLGRSYTHFVITQDGNVGVGITSPSSKLSVYGGVTLDGYFASDSVTKVKDLGSKALVISTNYARTNWGMNLWIEGNGNGYIQQQAFSDSGTTYPLVLQPFGGNVGIGLKYPSAKLHVSGDILATGAMTFYSMRKLKNVVDERGLSLNELSTIKPTRYTWKDGRDNRLHFGGIADDIQQVLPEVVYKTSDGILTMDYGNAAFAVASSLIKPVIDHEKRIAMLEEENKQLRQEVERLKSA